ncbi:MAG: tetratricopeptide repeat protein [Pyrinomonadaceae bacterium]
MAKIYHLCLGAVILVGVSTEIPLLAVTHSTKAFMLRPPPAIQGGNSISGHIFGESRRPVADVYVELQDEVYTTIGRAKTNTAGFFAFRNLSQGTFRVRALPYGTDYAEQTQEVTIQNVSIIAGGGSDNAQVDIYLKVKAASTTASPFAVPGTIFVQDVPVEAKKLYEQGVGKLREKKEKEGFENIKSSLEIFPNYYMALDRLGGEYVARGYYEAGFILLMKAIEVNPRSFSSMFGLGVAQYNLKRTTEAVETLRRATNLYDKSINAHLWLGLALKRAGKLDQAEASLKRANELSKGKIADVHWQMARLHSEQKRYKEAADELELYLKYLPDKSEEQKIRQLIQQLREKTAKQ